MGGVLVACARVVPQADGLFLVRSKGAGADGTASYAITLVCGQRFEHHVLAKTTEAGYTLNGATLARTCRTIGDAVAHLSANKETMTRVLEQAVKNPLADMPGVSM